MSAGSANKSSSGAPSGVPAAAPTAAASETGGSTMEVDPVQLISDGLSAVTEGCKLPVKMAGPGDDWPMAEVGLITLSLSVLHPSPLSSLAIVR